jgi:hypothetical protein
MATKPPITKLDYSKFMGALLAPLPNDSEPLESPEFIKHLLHDWRRGMEEVQYAEAGHAHEAIGLRLGIVGHSDRVNLLMYKNWMDAEAEQCLIPAPTAKELRWKKRRMLAIQKRPEVAAAIARDEARFAAS